MTKLSDIFDGFVKTFTMDDPKHPKPRQSVCRECEIVGAGFMSCVSAYMGHLTRVGRLSVVPGTFFTIVSACFGLSLLIPPADDEVLVIMKEIQKERMEKRNRERSE